MFGVPLLFVGVILWVDGMAMIGKSEFKGSVPANAFAGTLFFLFCVYLFLAKPAGDPLSYFYSATIFMFACTFLWKAYIDAKELDPRGLGVFCQFAAITSFITAYYNYVADWRFGVMWLMWAIVFTLFHMILNLGFQSPRFIKSTGMYMLLAAILTGWLPGYLMLIGKF